MLCLAGVVAIALRSALDLNDDEGQAQPLPYEFAVPSVEPVPSLVVPTALGNRRIYELEATKAVERKIKPAMSFVPGIEALISATYTASSGDSSLDSKRLVTFTAGMIRPALQGTALAKDPFDRLRERSVAEPVNITDVGPGSLGGQAKCGTATFDGYEAKVCAWADRHTVGLVVFFGSTMDEAKAEFVTIRELIERRG
jgi:hypothetical protein